MKKLDSYDIEMLEKDVEKYVKAYNSWDIETKVSRALDSENPETSIIYTALYIMGWKYNLETDKYER